MANSHTGDIMVVGHKNPDTDSICSAIAYARLKEKVTGFDGKTPYFVINFDDSISDFLYDTGEEKTDI